MAFWSALREFGLANPKSVDCINTVSAKRGVGRTTMAQGHTFAIPPELRQLLESNLAHARSTYGQIVDMLAQGSGLLAKAMPTSEMAAALEAIQQRIIQFAKQNADAYFTFAGELTRANDIQELLAIQNRYAAAQMHALTNQAQEMARLIAETTQRI